MAKKKHKAVTEVTAENLDTYFKQRMFEMGITDTSEHHYTIPGDFPSPDYKQPVFAETEAGNIAIHYPCLWGGAEPIKGTEAAFTRLRYKPENQPAHNVKYFQERGSGVHIFWPPAVVEKFRTKAEIETLYLVEGEFKAMAASLAGVDIAGLGGKDSFRDEEKKYLHADIIAIIQQCKVQNLVLLLDADTLQVKWDWESEPEKDLSKGLYGFFSTAINFREATKSNELGLRDAYFGHLKLNNLATVAPGDHPIKGLDDLLYAKRAESPDLVKYITDDLERLDKAKVYFDIMNIGALSPNKIRSYFWLNFYRGVPNTFYANNTEILKDREFKFSGATFQFVPETGLQMIKHADTEKYIRVGTNYYKMIEIPDPNGILQPSLEGWSAAEIQRDYGKSFFSSITKYDAFCNVPCNTHEYQQEAMGCYNLYYQLTHVLEEGKFPVIDEFLKHAFGERELPSGFTSYDLILDYFTILYKYPTQPLPIISLYSQERNTGKSTGIWLVEDMFMANYTEITSDILEDHLNDDWASKLVIALDEGFIEKNKILQKLKNLSTAHKIKLRGMYAGRKPVPFFGKFWITTNDKNFIKVEEEETRFWINQVPVLKKIDPDIRKKMQAEIPYFMHFLANRDIKHPRVSRHWFHPDNLVTEIGREVKNASKGWFEKELRTMMTNKFFHYRYHTLYYTHEEMEAMFATKAVKFRSDDIRRQLQEVFGLKAKLGRWKHPNEPDTLLNASTTTSTKHKRCYTFKIEDFISKEEINEELKEFGLDYDEIIAMRGVPASNEPDDDMPF